MSTCKCSGLDTVKELAYKIVDCLARGEVQMIGELLHQSWQQRKRFASGVTNPLVDECYEVARANGAVWGKLTGAGRGGFLMLHAGLEFHQRITRGPRSEGPALHGFLVRTGRSEGTYECITSARSGSGIRGMRKSDKIRVVVCSVIVDIVAISAAMVIAYHLRVLGALFPYFGAAECEPYVHTAFVAFPIWLVSFFCARLYSPTVIVKWVAEFSLVSKASTFGVIILTLVSFVERRALLSRGWLLLVWALSICLVMIGRTLLRVGLAQLRCRRCFMSRILVVGANERAVTIARQFAMNPKSGATVVGVLDEL